MRYGVFVVLVHVPGSVYVYVYVNVNVYAYVNVYVNVYENFLLPMSDF